VPESLLLLCLYQYPKCGVVNGVQTVLDFSYDDDGEEKAECVSKAQYDAERAAFRAASENNRNQDLKDMDKTRNGRAAILSSAKTGY